jgi:hypothetical protein
MCKPLILSEPLGLVRQDHIVPEDDPSQRLMVIMNKSMK